MSEDELVRGGQDLKRGSMGRLNREAVARLCEGMGLLPVSYRKQLMCSEWRGRNDIIRWANKDYYGPLRTMHRPGKGKEQLEGY